MDQKTFLELLMLSYSMIFELFHRYRFQCTVTIEACHPDNVI